MDNLSKRETVINKPKISEIKNDMLRDFFMEDNCMRAKSYLFMRRIEDSNRYILLFPTGLILTIQVKPFLIVGQMQLSIWAEDFIVDYKYTRSNDGKMHAIWLLDSCRQVWKCSNELSPMDFSWDLTKVQLASPSGFSQFFKQAMTYDDFYMMSLLQQLDCYSKTGYEKMQDSEFLFAFNKSATKQIFVFQPNLQQKLEQTRASRHMNLSEKQYLEYRFGCSESQIKEYKIAVFAIVKKQANLFNKLIPFIKKQSIGLENPEFKKKQQL